MVTRQIRVSGRVQGVGYREALRAEAARAGICGWVRNRADGSVEALLQGSAEAVERILGWARRGPGMASVTHLDAYPPAREFERSYSRFEVWPSR